MTRMMHAEIQTDDKDGKQQGVLIVEVEEGVLTDNDVLKVAEGIKITSPDTANPFYLVK